MGANATKFEGELAPSEPEILGEVIFSTSVPFLSISKLNNGPSVLTYLSL
jgi:hypothetical protein